MKIDNELKQLIPPLADEEYKLLEKSILKDGCRDALITWNNTLIDGHNRYEICKKHDIPFATKEKEFDSFADAKEWMINNQFARRNLPLYLRATLALKLKPIIEEKARENLQIYGGNQYESGGSENSPKVQKIDTREVLAKQAGVSSNTISKVERIEEKATPEIKEQLRKGEISIHKAFADIKKEEKKQELEEKKLEYKKRVEEAIETNFDGKVDIFDTEEKYRIVYADPPWSYNDKQDTPMLGGAVKHYATMPLADICNLPIENLTKEDAVLFMWTTSPLLEDSFKVINAWGFKYKSSFIWDKVKHVMGHYNSVRHEFLLIATKGSCTPDNKKLYDSVQSIERTEHSKKPKEFMNIIDDLYIHGERIELFARRQDKEGWSYWGNEV